MQGPLGFLRSHDIDRVCVFQIALNDPLLHKELAGGHVLGRMLTLYDWLN